MDRYIENYIPENGTNSKWSRIKDMCQQSHYLFESQEKYYTTFSCIHLGIHENVAWTFLLSMRKHSRNRIQTATV